MPKEIFLYHAKRQNGNTKRQKKKRRKTFRAKKMNMSKDIFLPTPSDAAGGAGRKKTDGSEEMERKGLKRDTIVKK